MRATNNIAKDTERNNLVSDVEAFLKNGGVIQECDSSWNQGGNRSLREAENSRYFARVEGRKAKKREAYRPPTKLDVETQKEAVAYVAEGHFLREAAEKFGVSLHTVRNYWKKHESAEPRHRKCPYTLDDLLPYRSEGKTYAQIAEKIGWSTGVVKRIFEGRH